MAQADVGDLNDKIKDLESLYKEASGFKKKELKARIEEAKADREARIQAAQISADASRYGSDKGLEGTQYSSDAGERNSTRSADASKYGSDKSYESSIFGSQAGERNAQRSADASRYGSDQSAASSRYGTDADIYKTQAEQGNKRSEQALSFLNTYSTMAGQPSNFLQASQYARLGRQVEGMPGMIQDLLGNVNPNATPAGGNSAFRTGTADMPQNAAMSAFGANPLGLVSTRAAEPQTPVWQGGGQNYQAPQQYAAAPSNYAQNYATSGGYAMAPSGYGLNLAQESTGPASDMTNGQASLMGGAFSGVQPYTTSYGQPTGQSSYGQPAAHRDRYVTGAPSAYASYGAASGMPSSYAPQPYRAGASVDQNTGQVQGNPTILDGGRLVADYDPTEEAFKAGTRELMMRGAHRWGNQALEKMTGTERSMLESGIKDAGGVYGDYAEAYGRSRIGNEGSGRSL